MCKNMSHNNSILCTCWCTLTLNPKTHFEPKQRKYIEISWKSFHCVIEQCVFSRGYWGFFHQTGSTSMFAYALLGDMQSQLTHIQVASDKTLIEVTVLARLHVYYFTSLCKLHVREWTHVCMCTQVHEQIKWWKGKIYKIIEILKLQKEVITNIVVCLIA